MAEQVEPFPLYNFLVEIDGLPAAGFVQVSGLESSIEVIEYREGTDPALTHRKLPGKVTYANVVLKAGVAKDRALYDWHKEWVTGGAGAKRKAVRIVLLDRSGTRVLAWRLHAAWPVKYTGPTLNATANEVAIETIELAHEGMDTDAD